MVCRIADTHVIEKETTPSEQSNRRIQHHCGITREFALGDKGFFEMPAGSGLKGFEAFCQREVKTPQLHGRSKKISCSPGLTSVLGLGLEILQNVLCIMH